MARNIDRQEALRIAAEKMKLQKEKEAREEREFYQRITSGTPWLIFKTIVGFCTIMALVATIEHFIDGPTKKLTDKDWKIDRNWEYTWHKVLDVEGYMFTPHFRDWYGHTEGSLVLTYTPIFRTGKKLSYEIDDEKFGLRIHEEIRQRSIFTWFPTFQIFLLIPFITYIFRRQSPWFNFGRIASMVFVFPGALLVIFFTML